MGVSSTVLRFLWNAALWELLWLILLKNTQFILDQDWINLQVFQLIKIDNDDQWDQPVVEMSHSDLLLSHETGQTGGEQPVHPHDKEVCEDVGEGEVERDVVHPGVCWQ